MATVQECVKWYKDRGYCRVSNKHRMVSRIDDPAWLYKLADKMHTSVAHFLMPNGAIDASWADHYRRVFSKDNIHGVEQEVFNQLPRSGESVFFVAFPDPSAAPVLTLDRPEIQLQSIFFATPIMSSSARTQPRLVAWRGSSYMDHRNNEHFVELTFDTAELPVRIDCSATQLPGLIDVLYKLTAPKK